MLIDRYDDEYLFESAYYSEIRKLLFQSVFSRVSGGCPAMILVQKSMLRFTTIGQMFRKRSMPTQLKFLISGLLAGESIALAERKR